MTDHFKQESNRLILMIDAAYLQAAMLQDDPDLRHRMKQLFKPFWNSGRRLSNQLKLIGEATGKADEIDNEAAFVFETLREICDSKNRIEALAVLKMYNAGQMRFED